VATLRAGMMRFQLVYAAVSVIGLVLLLVIQRIIVLGALKPLRSVRDHMKRLERGEIDRVDAEGPEEIMPLIEELNRLLGAMVRRTKRSRESLGNLAHSLKTRLTLLNQLADSAEINTRADLRSSIHQSTAAMSQAVERELKRARLMGDIHPGRRIDLNTEIEQLSQTLQRLYAKKNVDIEFTVSADSRFAGDAEDLLEMLGNLLDNACKWCRSKVVLTVSGSDAVSFVIEDDGPGCSASELDALVRRGYRADESQPGSGLGLAIVHDIVEGYSGQLAFERSTRLGGLRVEVRFFENVSA
jgi:signal transduction histidine kinase